MTFRLYGVGRRADHPARHAAGEVMRSTSAHRVDGVSWASMSSRFSLSFPGRRGSDDPWFRIGSVDVTTSVLVPLLCVASMFIWTISPAAIDILVLFADDVRRAQLWRLVTWPLANRPDVWTVLMLAMLWYFGRELERLVGRNRYLSMLLYIAIVSGVVATVVGVDIRGARNLEICVFCLFCAELPSVRFWGGIPAWVFAAVIVGVELLQLIGLRRGAEIIVLLTSLVTAAVAARSYGLLTAYPWVPSLARTAQRRPKAPKPGRAARRADSGGTVVSGPWQAPTSGLTETEQAELDALLDKTSAAGLDALSRTDKARLNELSKKLRSR